MDHYNTTMEPVLIEPISPFSDHPTLVTPFAPVISYVDTLELSQTSVTPFDDVSTDFSPTENLPTFPSPGYVNGPSPVRPAYSLMDGNGINSPTQHIPP